MHLLQFLPTIIKRPGVLKFEKVATPDLRLGAQTF